ncbi:DUF1194 domain-containing protein [Neorhizobium sp. NPDC001467]|uniref:DUF1194 domain-containing protein n=1 Tax=Neorhizobium sp. NPDC001467 TaxID=3390595 RepID=UPI003D0300AB
MLVTLAMLMGLSATPPVVAAAGGGEVDVELALAVDVSRSMDYEEIRIQRQGYVEALSHPEFITAVQGGMLGRIALSYYEWAGEVDQASVIDWQIIATAQDAKAFGEKIAARPIATQRRTSISAAISFGAASIVSNQYRGMRQVIDVSGDGPNNIGVPVLPVRDKAIEAGLVINGLAIMLRPSGTAGGLDRYYFDCVAGGPGSFVLPVLKIEDFAIAIRRKMVMEVSNTAPAPTLQRIAADAPPDCLSGERQWQEFLDR